MKKRILFLTGTRADFGKLKSLMYAIQGNSNFELFVFVTGMHLIAKYGNTYDEVRKCGFENIFYFINQRNHDPMDTVLANTIQGLSNYISVEKPDMIIVHGDRVEALAGAIVGALNNILVAHIEGGETSGTIDESIRHSVSKLAHLHFVANEEAKKRLRQMGEIEDKVFVIGSPDIDLMLSSDLPGLPDVKKHYQIEFEKYAIVLYHPVTTSLHSLLNNTQSLVNSIVNSNLNYIVIFPNNDSGSEIILEQYECLNSVNRIRVFPSIRFESFLVLLKNCDFMIGNSSAGIREAPFYSIPSINIGNRQNGRFFHESIIQCGDKEVEITEAIKNISNVSRRQSSHFGDGKSTERFSQVLNSAAIWQMELQKCFIDID